MLDMLKCTKTNWFFLILLVQSFDVYQIFESEIDTKTKSNIDIDFWSIFDGLFDHVGSQKRFKIGSKAVSERPLNGDSVSRLKKGARSPRSDPPLEMHSGESQKGNQWRGSSKKLHTPGDLLRRVGGLITIHYY